jgi:hypothetical protein
MPKQATTGRKGRAGLGNLNDVFAGKDEPVAALAEPLRATKPEPAPSGPPARASDDGRMLITTVRFPGYLAENIRRWLYEHPEHTQHTMIFAGLAQLGIQVHPKDLEPQRRPRASRHR